MLYLIGGPPRTGKTTLAAALAQRTSLPYFSIDHIAQVIIPYIPEADHAVRLPLRVAIQAAGYSNDVFYTTYTPEQAVALYERQAQTLWPGVENFIKYVDHGVARTMVTSLGARALDRRAWRGRRGSSRPLP